MYQVISEFEDIHTGRRVQPDEEFVPADEKQAERLVRAGCLVRVANKKSGGESTVAAPAEAPPKKQKRRR